MDSNSFLSCDIEKGVIKCLEPEYNLERNHTTSDVSVSNDTLLSLKLECLRD